MISRSFKIVLWFIEDSPSPYIRRKKKAPIVSHTEFCSSVHLFLYTLNSVLQFNMQSISLW